MWYKQDPRVIINKYDDIIILRPDISGNGAYLSGTACVDVKETYCIFTSFKDHKYIKADEDWDQDWIWTFLPSLEEISKL